jgi:hypothetical protein
VFPPRRNTPDGLEYWCRSCLSEYRKAKYVPRPKKPPPTERECHACGEVKPLEQFNRNRTKSRGRDAWCKVCRSNYYKHSGYFHEYYLKNRERKEKQSKDRYARDGHRIRAQVQLKRYGLTPEEYKAMFDEQDGKCAICRRETSGLLYGKPRGLSVDHSHEPDGKVRGLLCNNCNMAIGLLRDNPEFLRTAANYLEKHQTEPGKPQ